MSYIFHLLCPLAYLPRKFLKQRSKPKETHSMIPEAGALRQAEDEGKPVG